eukprot:319019_1
MGNITTNVVWVGTIVKSKNDDIIPNNLLEDLNFKSTCVCTSSTWDLIFDRVEGGISFHNADEELIFNFWTDGGCEEPFKNNRHYGKKLMNMTEKLSVGIGVADFFLEEYVETNIYKIVENWWDRVDYEEYRLMGTPVCIHTLVNNFLNGKVTESEIFTVDISCLKNPGIIRITITFDIEKDKYSSIWTVSHVLDEVPENALAKSYSTEHENDSSDKSAQSAEIPGNAN